MYSLEPTTGFTKTLYPLDDKINIWLDKESLNTIKVVKKIKQGSYRKILFLI